MKNRVEGYDHLYKDPQTGVIVNRSNIDRERYRISKQQALNSMASQQEISRLSKEMDEIKSLLQQLLKK